MNYGKRRKRTRQRKETKVNDETRRKRKEHKSGVHTNETRGEVIGL